MFIGFERDGWIVGQAIYPLLLEPIFVMDEAQIQLAFNYSFAQPDNYPIVTTERDFRGKINIHPRIPKILLSIGLAMLIFYFTPVAINSVVKGNENIVLDAESERIMQALQENKRENYVPVLDDSLPLGSYIKIPSIGVDTSIYEESLENHEEALKKGAWRVPDYSTPDRQGIPMILAAHRFGYISWSNLFRRQHSFYNLPKLSTGDTVEIIWNQRKYIYAIYAESEGKEISDYSADLILYTCVDLSSDVRIFRYAKLLKV